MVKTQHSTSQLWATILNRLVLSASVFSTVTWPEYSAHKTPISYYTRSVQSSTGHPFRVTPMPVFRSDGWGEKFRQSEFSSCMWSLSLFFCMSLKQDSLVCAPAPLSQIYHSYYHSLNTLSFLFWLLLCYLERSYWNSNKGKLEDYCYTVSLRLSLTRSLWNSMVSWVLVQGQYFLIFYICLKMPSFLFVKTNTENPIPTCWVTTAWFCFSRPKLDPELNTQHFRERKEVKGGLLGRCYSYKKLGRLIPSESPG